MTSYSVENGGKDSYLNADIKGITEDPDYRDKLIKKLAADLSQPSTDVGKVSYEGDENEERGNWSGRFDFFLSCLGYAVGIGNVWRFPYLCYKNGGGAFLIPYFLFLFTCGLPVFLLDLSLGQFSSQGPATCFEFAPIFRGIGYGMCFVSTIVAIYYNLVIGYAIFYFGASIRATLLWISCYNSWNTELCRDRLPVINCSIYTTYSNGTCYNNTQFMGLWNESVFKNVTNLRPRSSAEEYYKFEVLGDSGDINNLGIPQWKLVLCLLGAWIIVFLCLIKGIKSSGKVVYFTALFPYIVLLVLFFRGVTLSNAIEGIKFYIVPNFSKLSEAGVWKDAASQIFFSLSICWGGLMAMSSYNRFHNHVVRDTIMVCLANSGTSIFAGFVIFSYIGHLAGEMGVSVDEVTKEQFGLAFVIYPEALTKLPISPFWSVLFFFMLILLGLDSQFAMIETVTTSLNDVFPKLRHHKVKLMGALSVVLFLLGLPMTCAGGNYLLTLIDSYGGGWNILMIGMFECIAIGWFYGRPGFGKFHRFSEDISLILQRPIWPIWRILWQFVSPLLILFIILFSWIKYTRTTYTATGNLFPVWAEVLGWLIALTPLVLVFGNAIFLLCFSKNLKKLSICDRFAKLTRPTYKWGPSLPKHRMLMVPYLERLGLLNEFYIDPANHIRYRDVFPLDNKGAPLYPLSTNDIELTKSTDNDSGIVNPGFQCEKCLNKCVHENGVNKNSESTYM